MRDSNQRTFSLSRLITPRFSLLTLLLFVTCVALVLGYIKARGTNPSSYKKLEKGGAFITYDYHKSPEAWKAHDNDPTWLKELFGEQYENTFYKATKISMCNKVFPDRVFAELEHCKSVEFINLDGSNFSDEHCRFVAVLPKLKTLWIKRTKITDAGLKILATSNSLSTFECRDTAITDQGVAWICESKSLAFIDLGHTQITDKSGTFLAKCPSLTAIACTGQNVGDDFVAPLAKHENLQLLGLSGTNATERSIEYFARMKSLRMVELDRTKFSGAGYERLKRELPQLKLAL